MNPVIATLVAVSMSCATGADAVCESIEKENTMDITKEVVWVLEAEEGKQAEEEYRLENLGGGRFYAVSKTGSQFLDETGKEIPVGTYNYIDEGGEGLYAVGYGGKNGFMDRDGKVVVPLVYPSTEPFSEGIAVVETGQRNEARSGAINKQGEVVVPFLYRKMSSFSEGLSAVWGTDKNGALMQCGFVDKKGQEVIPLQYDYCRSFSQGLAAVRQDGNWGYVNPEGQIVIPLQYANVSSFAQGTAFAMKTDKTLVMINTKGEEQKTIAYDGTPYFDNDNNAKGYWKTEKIVEHPNGDHVHESVAYDNKGNVVPMAEYQKVRDLSDGLLVDDAKEGDQLESVTEEGKTVSYTRHKQGYVDERGNVVIPYVFELAHPFVDGYAVVSLDGKTGMLRNPIYAN